MRRLLLLAVTLLLLVTPVQAAPSRCSKPNPPPSCATPTPVPSPTATPAGEWTEVFYEPFDQPLAQGSFPSAVANRWQSYLGPDSWSGSYYDGTRVVSWHDGVMDYWLHNEGGQWLTAAAQPILDSSGTAAGKYQIYGRYEARWMVQSVSGFYWAPLLWPRTDAYLAEGEVDWPEGRLTGNINGFIHHTGSTSGGDQKACTTGVLMAGAWHTTVTEWRPGSVKLYLDDALICEETVRTPSTEMRWVLQSTGVQGTLPAPGAEAHVLIDHARIWSYQ